MKRVLWALLALGLLGGSREAWAGVLVYGDKDVLNGTGTYPIDPTTGATLIGLAPGAVTFGQPELNHTFPFSPSGGEFPGTDQIYVGSTQTGFHDGYSGSAQRINGPQVINLNYASLVPPGQTVLSLTLGIGADDFQFPVFGQPFTASINGVPNAALTAVLNSLDQSGPQVQFFTLGLSPALLSPTHTLTLSIDQGGDGGDGWAIDFLTVGVTSTPEPSGLALFGLASLVAGYCGWRRRVPSPLA